MDPKPNEGLHRLEAHMAHLEHQYEQLNQVVIEQGREITRLRQHLQTTSAALESMELERIKAHNPKPPHSVI